MKDIILSIQNTEIETLGNFKELFESDGYIIETIHVKKDKIPKELDKYAGIVILGGYMSVVNGWISSSEGSAGIILKSGDNFIKKVSES